jgi:hypothetical protein
LKSWMITLAVLDVLATLSLLGIAKRMNTTRVSSPGLTFGLLFIFLGGVTFGGMNEAGQLLMGGFSMNEATKLEVRTAIQELTRWRDFIWTTQVMIGASLLSRWVLD